MSAISIVGATVCFAALATGAGKGSAPNASDHQSLAASCVSSNRATAAEARQRLRAMGPAGLAILHEAYDGSQRAKSPGGSVSQFRQALDEVAAQRDAHTSRLYWHTDFEAAKAAARREGKPILSLRLMGKLTDEYSCANSRFFRTALYANADVSRALRDRFVLHWRTVRPVPQVTIDFGDGRMLRRTLTGNSAHYILDQQGRVVDVLPGLYGPQAFLQRLEAVESVAGVSGEMSEVAHVEAVRDWHSQQYRNLLAAWRSDLSRVGTNGGDDRPGKAQGAATNPPTARAAGAVAVGKRAVEQPILERIDATQANADAEQLNDEMSDDEWRLIAGMHAEEARLDAQSLAVLASHLPDRATDGPCRSRASTPLARMSENFESAMALDTVRNEYLLHRRIHAWFLEEGPFLDADELNERVYAELFLTPRSDPWLGLVPADTYTALDADGRLE